MDLAVKRLHERVEQLEEENRQLREALAPSKFAVSPLPGIYLPKKVAMLFSCLLAHGSVSKAKAYAAIYGFDYDCEPRVVDVYICKLRKQLQPHGWSIRTIHGQGYELVRPQVAA
jgi:DNA-binding response OmpR family regulator